MTILALAPHPDDETLGCGGALCLHARAGDRVAVVYLTSGELGLKHLPPAEAWRVREAEAAEAGGILGVAAMTFLRLPDWFLGEHVGTAAEALRPILEREAPAFIYLPHAGEWHPDHQAALPITHAALRGYDRPECRLRTYEVWTPLAAYDEVVDIGPVMTRKLRAVRCYRSQLVGFRYDRAVEGLGRYRGALAGRGRYAEVFGSADPGA